MAYRDDADLEFLGQMESQDLNDLVYCLTHDKDGDVRLTEELTMNELYKNHYPDHQKYWEMIAFFSAAILSKRYKALVW